MDADSSMNPENPESEPPPQPRRRKVRLDAEGNPIRMYPKATPAEKAQRIEEVRALLRVMMSDWEIKRTLANAWKRHPRFVEWYIALARKQNRAALDISEDQAVADAVNYWAARMKSAEIQVQASIRRINDANGELAKTVREIQEIEGADRSELSQPQIQNQNQRLTILETRRKTIVGQLKDLDAAKMRASMESRDAREHIDRLQGSFRPIKIARVNADGTDVARMTAEEIAEGLRLLGAGPAPRALPVFQQVNQVNQTFNTQVFNGVPGSELHGAPPREAINPPTPRVIEGTATSLPNGFHDLPVPVRGFSDSSSELDHDFGDG